MSATQSLRFDDDINASTAVEWPRSERFFLQEGHYFFATREGVNVGPFASKNLALRALELYKYVVNECSTSGVYASYIVTQL